MGVKAMMSLWVEIIFIFMHSQILIMRKILFPCLYLIFMFPAMLFSQKIEKQDQVRGSVTPERYWWDLLHYNIEVQPNIALKSISGKNTIRYKVLQEYQQMQIDLQAPMQILRISQDGKKLNYTRKFGAYFIDLVKKQSPGEVNELQIDFSGTPPEASNPPWDGGFVWQKDKNNKDFIANANQLLGSSSWLPSKDHPYDEPDQGMDMIISAPEDLMAVSNGRLLEVNRQDGKKMTFHWKVVNPINGYGININIADYQHFSETYQGEKGSLDCDYYVLPYHVEKARAHFKQVPKMLEAFEHWFGPYPFYEDGYKLVEAPYLGMEHQSSVTYGNGYQNGYLGSDLSNTGNGLKFDFIIIHESGHEWFANSLTNDDVADMWIHEGFTTYSEVLYLDYHFGTQAGNEYLIGYRDRTLNLAPVTGNYGLNQRGSNDMYIKGAAMIHTLRQVIDNDEKFRTILRELNKEFYHQTLSSAELEAFLINRTGLELQGFFDQYLRGIKIPSVRIKIKKGKLYYRFKHTVSNFRIPVKFIINGEDVWLQPDKKWKTYALTASNASVSIDENFYIQTERKK